MSVRVTREEYAVGSYRHPTAARLRRTERPAETGAGSGIRLSDRIVDEERVAERNGAIAGVRRVDRLSGRMVHW